MTVTSEPEQRLFLEEKPLSRIHRLPHNATGIIHIKKKTHYLSEMSFMYVNSLTRPEHKRKGNLNFIMFSENKSNHSLEFSFSME